MGAKSGAPQARRFVRFRRPPVAGVACARVARRLRPLTAQELFAALATLPGSRPVPAGSDGIEESRLVAGVEIARTRGVLERDLRRTWRERQRGGAAPLLLVADDPDRENGLRALGPVQIGRAHV